MNTPPIEDQDLARQLRSHYQKEIGSPTSSTLFWYKLSEQLPEQQTQKWWQRWFQAPVQRDLAASARRRVPARGLAVGLSLALVALLLVSGVFYTTSTLGAHKGQPSQTSTTGKFSSAAALLSALLQKDARVSALAFTQVNQAKNTSSGTVNLQKIYADANNVVLGYTFEGKWASNAKNAGLGSLLPTITLPNQQKLQASIMELEQKGNQVAVVAFYSGASIQGASRQLQLKISIPTDKTTEEFNPTVSFSVGKIIQINQSVTSNGRTITLERVVITPSETRFYYITSAQTPESLSWEVSVAGKTYHATITYYGSGENYTSIWSGNVPGFWHPGSNGPLQHGTWTVTATNSASSNMKGTWRFTFNVK